MVLRALAPGPARFCHIRRAIPGISDRLLAKRLSELADEGLVDRIEADGEAFYRLTERGDTVIPALDAIDAVKDVVSVQG